MCISPNIEGNNDFFGGQNDPPNGESFLTQTLFIYGLGELLSLSKWAAIGS